MRLEIDWTRCDGHGLCARLLPERISLDPDGFPVIGDARLDPVADAELLRPARAAAAACPVLALRVERTRPHA
ncbi:ferredoxin [Nocardioides flavescens]|uniref:Ferredoxin n=1 Tax=Nocardioides flavescens TaxID=2691959 RepID=A0A6L7F3L0_9ACTN|nr:ferredoxin [Nocardioides flavescens]MXG91820.1 ferredoxin [Nocardioides flavescens]